MDAIWTFLSQPGFWWGVVISGVLTGIVAPLIAKRSLRKSDERRAKVDTTIQTRKEEHERELDQQKADREQDERNKAIVFEAATDYASTVADLLVSAIDEKNIFNLIRDMFLTEQGATDPNAMEKIAFAQTQVSELKRLGLSLTNIKMFASKELMDSAVRVYSAMHSVAQSTTNALAKKATMDAAAVELDQFVNIFRSERGLPVYGKTDAEQAQAGYLKTLQAQVDIFRAESRGMSRDSGLRTSR
ncbi:hypothetical protein [Rhodococcoides corynebacterioides]|uniref:Uncharacterized protein n=1 Tax=Rhodococcoides corynebacterioides TaxID=53972 RepID=A0ABS7P950_9NOCA|nr:hypothetical protein [Rhodococcus corynebacterioides]MBY6368139.1 hypothetical protein [Rhodococcus corynebacterioides]MBY6409847.1 hypothetical protein [Rhodococcus corynebacterioides]